MQMYGEAFCEYGAAAIAAFRSWASQNTVHEPIQVHQVAEVILML
jgi:hypothetical protein